MVSVAVAQAVGVESPKEEAHAAARALLTQALQQQQQQQQQQQSTTSLLLLGLKALAGLAEEAREGFGGKLGDSVLPGS